MATVTMLPWPTSSWVLLRGLAWIRPRWWQRKTICWRVPWMLSRQQSSKQCFFWLKSLPAEGMRATGMAPKLVHRPFASEKEQRSLKVVLGWWL